MSKRTYICIDCRTSKRADAEYGLNTDYRCPECKNSLIELPWQWRIPKVKDDEGWKELRGKLLKVEANWIPRRNAIAKKKLQKLDRQIEQLSHQKETETGTRKLKRLRWQRTEIVKKYTESSRAGDQETTPKSHENEMKEK